MLCFQPFTIHDCINNGALQTWNPIRQMESIINYVNNVQLVPTVLIAGRLLR